MLYLGSYLVIILVGAMLAFWGLFLLWAFLSGQVTEDSKYQVFADDERNGDP